MRTFAQKPTQHQKKPSRNLIKSIGSANAARHGTHPLLSLQQSIGNQAVLRLLRLHSKPIGLGNSRPSEVPPAVDQVLATPGKPMEPATRGFMESRFGHDFSQVQLHSDSAANESAHNLGANAYTVGHHIVFGTGWLAPSTREGQRLLAHELSHVVQQSRASGGVSLQRDQKNQPSATPQDLVVVLDPGKDFLTLAKAIAPNAKLLRATSVEDLAKQLKAIKTPIQTLYFVAHMNEDGDLLFTAPSKMNFVRAETVAAKIKDSAQVENIDLRGCSIAQAPAEMEKIRTAIKATRVTGSTCSLVKQIADPIKLGKMEITQPAQLKDQKVKAAFEAGLKKARELFESGKKKCIVNDSVDGYFQTGGRLIAVWANPGSMADEEAFDDNKSICYSNLKVQKVDPTKKLPVIGPDDCKLLEIKKP